MIATTELRKQIQHDAESLATWLGTRQYVRPHQSIGEAVRDAVDAGHIRAEASYFTDIDPAVSIGRLRREQLQRLARSLTTASLASQRRRVGQGLATV